MLEKVTVQPPLPNKALLHLSLKGDLFDVKLSNVWSPSGMWSFF